MPRDSLDTLMVSAEIGKYYQSSLLSELAQTRFGAELS